MKTKIHRIAAANRGEADKYVRQLVEQYVDHDAWLRENVRAGIKQLDNGEYLTSKEPVT